MSSIATLRDCHVQSIKFWIKLTYERSILINPVGLWKIEMVWICLTYLFSYSASGKSFETLKFWNGNKTSNYKIFSIDVFGFDGSVTEWPGRVGVIICWSRVPTPTMLLSGFFSFAQCSTLWLRFVCRQPQLLFHLLERITLIRHFGRRLMWRTTCLGSINIA